MNLVKIKQDGKEVYVNPEEVVLVGQADSGGTAVIGVSVIVFKNGIAQKADGSPSYIHALLIGKETEEIVH